MNYTTSLDIQGDYAYVTGFNTDSIAIIDISDIYNPKQVGYFTSPLLDGAWTLKAKGDYLYVAGDGNSVPNGLIILDIHNKTNPYQVGYISGNMNDIYSIQVSKSGDYVYLTSQEHNKFYIINVTDKTNPQIKSELNVNKARSVTLDDAEHYAYIGTNSYDAARIKMRIVDITNLSNPINVSDLYDPIFSDVQAIDVSEDYLYTSSWPEDDLTIINIKDRLAPYIESIFIHPRIYGVMELHLQNNIVYMTSEYANSIVIVDVKDPNNPQLIGHFCNVTSLYYPYELDIVGDYLHVASKFGNSYTVLRKWEGQGELPLYNNSRCYNERPIKNRVGERVPDFNATDFLEDKPENITHPNGVTHNSSKEPNIFIRILLKLKFW